MGKNPKNIAGPLTWAFVIIVGGLMITPEGINPIVTSPAIRFILGILSIAVGAIGFISMKGKAAG
jgi:hypothetical protein